MPQRVPTPEIKIQKIVDLKAKNPSWTHARIAAEVGGIHKVTVAKYLKQYSISNLRSREDIVKDYLPENPSMAQRQATRMAVDAMFEGKQWAIMFFISHPTGKVPEREKGKPGDKVDPLAGAFGE